MGVIPSIKKGFSVATKSMNLVTVLFVFGLVWNLANIFLFPNTQDAAPSTNQTILIVAAGLVFILLTIFMQAGSMGYVRDLVKQGSANLDTFKSAGSKYYLRFLAIGLMVGSVIGVMVLGAAGLVALMNRSQSFEILGAIGAIVIVGIGAYLILLIFLAPYVAVADEKKALESIKISAITVRKNILKVLGIFLMLIAIGFSVGVLMGLLLGLANLIIKGKIAQIIFAVLSSAVNAFLGVLVTGAFMNFYLAISNPVDTTQA